MMKGILTNSSIFHNISIFSASIEERISVEDIHPDDVRGLLLHGVPPFPYKVAKSLDQDLYRNIEYDAWNTVRRGEIA